MKATKNNHFLVVKFLLEKKADESLRDDSKTIIDIMFMKKNEFFRSTYSKRLCFFF